MRRESTKWLADLFMLFDRLCQSWRLSDVARPAIAFSYTLQYVWNNRRWVWVPTLELDILICFYLCSICNTCVVPWGKDIDWPPTAANRHNKPHGVPKRKASARRLPRQATLQEYFLNINRFFFRYQLSDGSLLTVTKPWRWEDWGMVVWLPTAGDFSLKRPEWLWGPSRILISANRRLFPRAWNTQCVDLTFV